MQTHFSDTQLKNPDLKSAHETLRNCVHCGFCLATCPTYRLLGDELDGPRGRISLIQNMLEQDKPATAEVVKHIDRCLSCLGCQTTCPSGVNYMHLVDYARVHIENTYKRSLTDRLFRLFLSFVMPRRNVLAPLLFFGRLFRPVLETKTVSLFPRLQAMLRLLPQYKRRPTEQCIGNLAVSSPPLTRVALLDGCVQSVTHSHINSSARRLLARLGCQVIDGADTKCCGALGHHLGKRDGALSYVKSNIDVWIQAIEDHQIDAIIVTASGCGTMIKDYGYLLRNDARYCKKAERISAMAKDVTEFVADMGTLPQHVSDGSLGVAPHIVYQSPCSLQHGQNIHESPRELLQQAGFVVSTPDQDHLCCGSAGTYNILQPEIAAKLGEQKIISLELSGAEIVATGNVGCLLQLQQGTRLPIVHTIELLDWATGGPKPRVLDLHN